jgi:hypothetical protein
MGVESTAAVASATEGAWPGRATAPPRHGLGLPGAMSVSAGVHSLRRVGLTGCLGGSMAALGYAHTGLVAALPAATGLVALAASDLATRRFSLRTLRTSAVLVGVGLVLDSGRTQAWDRLLAAVVVTGLVGLALLGAWLGTRGIPFGDVLLTTFAVAVPAWLSPSAAIATVLAALVVALGMVLVRRARDTSDAPGVPLAPALLTGWMFAMVVG